MLSGTETVATLWTQQSIFVLSTYFFLQSAIVCCLYTKAAMSPILSVSTSKTRVNLHKMCAKAVVAELELGGGVGLRGGGVGGSVIHRLWPLGTWKIFISSKQAELGGGQALSNSPHPPQSPRLLLKRSCLSLTHTHTHTQSYPAVSLWPAVFTLKDGHHHTKPASSRRLWICWNDPNYLKKKKNDNGWFFFFLQLHQIHMPSEGKMKVFRCSFHLDFEEAKLQLVPFQKWRKKRYEDDSLEQRSAFASAIVFFFFFFHFDF